MITCHIRVLQNTYSNITIDIKAVGASETRDFRFLEKLGKAPAVIIGKFGQRLEITVCTVEGCFIKFSLPSSKSPQKKI